MFVTLWNVTLDDLERKAIWSWKLFPALNLKKMYIYTEKPNCPKKGKYFLFYLYQRNVENSDTNWHEIELKISRDLGYQRIFFVHIWEKLKWNLICCKKITNVHG